MSPARTRDGTRPGGRARHGNARRACPPWRLGSARSETASTTFRLLRPMAPAPARPRGARALDYRCRALWSASRNSSLTRLVPCASCQRRWFSCAAASIGWAPGKAEPSAPKSGKTMPAKKPSCVSDTPGFSRSAMRETARPNAFSLSPCAKSSCSKSATQLRWASQGKVRCPKSQDLSATCRRSTPSRSVLGTKPSARASPSTLPPSACDSAAEKAVMMEPCSARSVPRTIEIMRPRRRRKSCAGRLSRKLNSFRCSTAKAAARWWFSLTWRSL
mmetsp:Transcript_35461/g.99150  ORF Transcript_35461/g.99150 Transcript_35461/m.99150 type:complete len:275 (-) Transcript_35461:11-835(-)